MFVCVRACVCVCVSVSVCVCVCVCVCARARALEGRMRRSIAVEAAFDPVPHPDPARRSDSAMLSVHPTSPRDFEQASLSEIMPSDRGVDAIDHGSTDLTVLRPAPQVPLTG